MERRYWLPGCLGYLSVELVGGFLGFRLFALELGNSGNNNRYCYRQTEG